MHHLSPAALSLRRIQAGLATAAVAVPVLALDVAVRLAGEVDPPLPVAVVPGAVALVLGGLLFTWAGLVHRSWAWSLEEDHLRVDRGVLIRRSSLVPRRRVQHVSSRVGPLQRRFGLTSLEVHTAGARTPNVAVQHLDADDATRLRAELATGAVPADVA